MKKVSTLSKYALLGVFLCFCTMAEAQDFKVQHIQEDIGRSGGNSSLFTTVSEFSAVALPNNNKKTHAGTSGSTSVLEGDDMAGGRAITGSGTQLSYYRESGSVNSTTRFNTSVWEYIGSGGGANEFIVRGRYVATLNGDGTNGEGKTLATIDISGDGVSTANKCIPFITGILNSDTINGADSGSAIAYLDDSNTLTVKRGNWDNNVVVYITLVEFTGSNWTVLHGTSGGNSANTGTVTLKDDSDGTNGVTTAVSNWNNSIIFSQSKAQTDKDSGGARDHVNAQWPLLTPGSDNQSVDWTFDSGRTVNNNNKSNHFVHVLENSEIEVTRFTDTSNNVNESTIDITSANLTALDQSMIIGSSTNSNAVSPDRDYAGGWRNYYLNSTTEAAHWSHRSGNTMAHNIQIINLDPPATQTEGPGGITTNLELWLKADTGVDKTGSIPAVDSDPVVNWIDNTIYTNDATATSTYEPTFIENGFNFNPILDFDGSNEMTANVSASADVTIFAVTKGTNGTTKTLLNLDDGANASIDIEQTATTFQGSYTDSFSSISGVASATVTSGTPYLVNYRQQTTGGSNRMFINGIQTLGTAPNTNTLSGTLTAGIGADPLNSSTRWNGSIAEMIVYNYKVPEAERWQIESYLAIKYGLTIGVNGTSQNYVNSDGDVIWDIIANAGYNNDIAGIGQDNASTLNQKQSKTINTSDDITVGIKGIAATNSANACTFMADKTFLMWGHDTGTTATTTPITKDFGAGTGVTTNLSATPIERKWKMVVTDSVPTVKISIPKSMVTSAGGPQYVMIVSDTEDFNSVTANITSATMEDTGSNLEVDFYFEGTKYITFGSTTELPLGDRSAYFNSLVTPDAYLDAGNVNDLAGKDFTISAWIKRDTGENKFDIVSKRNYFNEGLVGGDIYTHGYAFRINQFDKFRMVWRNPGDDKNSILETEESIPDNEWHHVAATYDFSENEAVLYIDGIHVYDSADYLADRLVPITPMTVPSDSHFIIGAAHHIKRQQQMRGSIDEVRVWDVALSANQLRYIMNQEIEQNASLKADGKVLPANTTLNDIKDIDWSHLIAYYPMSTAVFGSIKDESNSGNDASMINYDNLDYQTAPLPYKTSGIGTNWDDPTTWENGDVQYLPGVVSYLYENEALDTDKQTMDYNIVEMDHYVTLDNSDTSKIPAYKNGNRTVLGLIVNSGVELQLEGFTLIPGVIPPPGFTDPTGQAITVSHYLKLDGTIDLEGESQLIQTEGSDLDTSSSGNIERDQQGTKDFYTYNYWSSPVGLINPSTNNTAFRLTDEILKNGTDPDFPNGITFSNSTYNGSISGTDITIADYWIWKYTNSPNNDYSSWQHVRESGQLNVGEGFTMKGVADTGGVITDEQNYVFDGKPNNGDISLTITAGYEYLVGNPYPSAIDADEFIKDNIKDGGNNANNVINGALYFWEHFASNTHYLSEYEGGYGVYTLMGGTEAITSDARINTAGVLTSTKGAPGQYIPVGQGFFVNATDPLNSPTTQTESVNGGDIIFKNSQRVFEMEGTGSSIFMKSSNTKTKKETTAKPNKDTRQKIKLMFDSPKGYHRQLLVGVDENASHGFDIGYDGTLIEDNKEDMFWTISNSKFIIQGVDHFNIDQTLPLGLKIDKEGLASIKIDSLENISDDLNIYIHDNELNITHDLRESEFEVFLTSGNYLDRFEVVFESNVALNIEDIEDSRLQVLYSNEKERIVLYNPDSKNIKSLEVFNILGQSVFKIQESTSETYLEYKAQQIATGAYIIKVTTDEGTHTKKILAN